jgi:hypothetical protein
MVGRIIFALFNSSPFDSACTSNFLATSAVSVYF